MLKVFKVGKRRAGAGQPCFIIAEAGVNHNGNIRLAKRLIDAARKAGADAVKFQTFRAERLVTAYAPKARYQLKAGMKESQYEMLHQLELSDKEHELLKAHCKKRGILFLSSPFDETSADLLEKLGVPAFKIGSGEITNIPFLKYAAKKRKPIILSTGMSSMKEVRDAVMAVRSAGCKKLILLHCVSNYPANPNDVNLRAMQTMAQEFHQPVGFSDHTLGIAVSLAAAALGACVLEKHLTLDRRLPGPDHAASLEPSEFSAMVKNIRIVESSLGHGRKEPAKSEINTAAAARKSLVAARAIPSGTRLTREHLAIKRPGTGFPPSTRSRLMGCITRRGIAAGSLIQWEMLH